MHALLVKGKESKSESLCLTKYRWECSRLDFILSSQADDQKVPKLSAFDSQESIESEGAMKETERKMPSLLSRIFLWNTQILNNLV